MQLVVGLGNPGARYANTRHNAGFLVVDRLARRCGVSVSRKQFKALVETVVLGGKKVILCKPQTFMNLSGEAVTALRGYYKVEPSGVLVIHDEVDLPFSDIRLKMGGGHGGHNGLRDISKHIGAAYGRCRFGVGRPPAGWDTADYVLGQWAVPPEDLDGVVERAADAVELALASGLSKAMQSVNARPKKAKSGNREQPVA